MTATLAQTPLHEWHTAHGGRMVDFAGWSMPVHYSSIVAEHQATRTAATLFDVSHMGRLRFDGSDAAKFLDGMLTRRIDNSKPGQIRYSLITNDAGGILDDVLVYHMQDAGGESYYWMVVNASNREKIVRWLTPRLADGGDVEFADLTESTAMIALQGPKAMAMAGAVLDWDPTRLKYYTGRESEISLHEGLVSRTGYTGEDGLELILPSVAAADVWGRLHEAGATAAGLGCRDTLRLEAAMPLYGHELSEEINPIQAGLKFAVNTGGRDFIGRDAIERLSADASLPVRVGLELDSKRAPREGYPILAGDQPTGKITSGTHSPTLGRPIAMGYVASEHATVGTELNVDIRGRCEAARVVKMPFYRRP
jgi:aminomethyltransferase